MLSAGLALPESRPLLGARTPLVTVPSHRATADRVHVIDVAAAHIAAAERAEASGRYMMIAWWGHLADMCASIGAAFPALVASEAVPTEVDVPAGATLAAPGLQDSSRVTRELGVVLRGLDECMRDSVGSLIARGLVPAVAAVAVVPPA